MSRSATMVTRSHAEFLVSGMAFGAALMFAGVHSPNIIIDQMRLKSFHMLVVFLNASAVSSIVIYNFRKYKPNIWQPRTAATLGFFSRYDGNIIGGMLLGAGMALTGACPGTLLPQLAAGAHSGKYVLSGGLLGGIMYSKLRPYIHTSFGAQANYATAKRTVYEQMGISEVKGILLFVLFCYTIAEGAKVIFPGQEDILSRATWGGYAVGGSQALSMYLTGNTLGVSAAYERFGDWFWSLVSGSTQRPDSKKLAFPIGSVVGALAYRILMNVPAPVAVDIGALKAISGGMMMIIGGRIGGGCTSGHGISGMSMLSTSSIVSVASMFGTGILVGLLIN